MRNKKQRAKISARILAVLLCVCLAAQNVPMNTFAAETAQGQTQERSAGEFTLELSSEPFSESAEKATEEQAEETVQETVSEKIEEMEREEVRQETTDNMTLDDCENIEETETLELSQESLEEAEGSSIIDSASQIEETSCMPTEEMTEEEVSDFDETEELSELSETETDEDNEALYEMYYREYEELVEELAAADNAYKITENQLFMQAPQYLLKNSAYDTYLTRCFDYTREAMDSVSSTQDILAAFMKGLKDGAEFLTKEIASAYGWTDSNYKKQKKDLAGELVREYMGNEEYLGVSAEKLSKNLKGLNKIANADLKIQKEEYAKQLKEACTAMSDNDVDKAVDAIFGKLDKISGYADKTVDAFDIVTSIMANQELELEVIDDLIVALQDSNDRDLYEGLIMIRSDITSDIGTYILENYLTDKALGKVKGILVDAIYNAVSGVTGIEITTSGKVIVGVAVNVGVWCYEKFQPSVDDIVHTTIMYNYALTLDTAVTKYKMKFYKKQAKEEDIDCLQAALTAELCAVKLMMKYAKGLTSNKALKNTLENYRESIGESPITYTGYINYYRMLATKDIDAGLLTVTDDSAVQKTPDGTIIDEKYDPTESIKAKYAEIQKKYPPNAGKTWTGKYGGAEQCFGFARMVFNLLFGCDMPKAYKGKKRYELVDNTNVTVIGQLSGSNVTADNMKKLVSQGKLGDVTQGYGAPYGQHTMILQELTDTGAVFYQCNLYGECDIYTKLYTWEYLAGRYGTGDGTSGNGFTLYRANNYGTVYGDGSDLFYDDSVNFVINDGVLVKYNGWQSHVVIPDTVTAIGDGAFQNNKTMMTVEIPDGVISIGNSAFYGCTNLVGVVIPDSVESIGSQAFYGCTNLVNVQLPENEKFVLINWGCFYNCKHLKGIEIPQTVTEIGSTVFYNCEKLVDVDLPNKLVSIDYWAFTNVPIKKITIPKSLERAYYAQEGGAFYNCSTLKEVNFEEGITSIPSCLFMGCNGIEEIVIPNTVTSIGWGSFKNCKNLEKVSIPDSVTEIGSTVFYNCEKLVDVDLPNKLVSIDYWAFTNVPIKKITIPKSLERAYYAQEGGAFYNCSTLKEVNFEEGITSIPSCLFMGCNGIEEIVIPNTVTSIGWGSFKNCKNLEKVSIPDSVTEIGSTVFYNCEKLVDVDLPNKLVSIDYWAFTNVPIKKITIPKSLERAYYAQEGGAFYNCSTLKEVNFEEGITSIPSYLFMGCNGVEEITIPNTVTSIGWGSFENCKNLEKAIIPSSVTAMEGYVFYNCVKLPEISIPDTVASMGNYIFSGCTSLKNAKLPNIRVNISDGMFQNCTSLTTIDLPKTVTIIKKYAFQNAGLTELTLPENVTAIESSAFDGCTNLAKVTLKQTLKTIGSYAFRNNDALPELTIPNSVTTIGDYAFQDSDALTTVTISDSVTALGQYIFAHCDTLKDVKLGTGLTKIPSYAFNLCPELQKIVLPYRITTVDANAFTNCTKLTEVTIPRGTTTISASAFSYPDRLTIYGISGTYAETYANQIGARFVNREVNATDVTLSSTSLSMITGAKHTLVMSVTPSDFTDEVVWKSSDTNILTVDNMGVITAKAVGTANVRVAVGEKTASCAVTVVQPVTSISLSKSTLSLDAFEDYTLTASVYPDNAADKSVEWATSDEKIAIVSQTGKVTPLSKGTADITVTAKDGSGRTAKCTVTVTSEGQLCTQYSQLESAHNYANNTNKVWKYTYSGAKTLEVTFDSKTNVDDGYDFIYIYDKDNKEIKKATGTQLAGKTIQTTGDTIKIKLVSDEAVTAWGFRVTKISADGSAIDPGEEKPGESETSTEDSTEGTSEEEESSEEHPTESESDEPDGSLKDGLYITGLKTKTYTGSTVKQNLKVYYNKNLLQEGRDYTLSYKNNKTAGTALVMIKTKGNLTGVVTKTFQIQPRKINDTNVIIEDAVYSYDKKAHKKAPAVMYNGKKLKEGKDYQAVEYGTGDYTSVGTYTVKIKGIGNYAGTYDSAKVIIVDKDKNLSKAKIAKIPAQEYQNGAAVELPDSLVKVELNKTTLKKGSDYTVSYANNTEAGKAILIIKGKGQYAGTKTITFTIKRTPTALTDSMVTNKKEIGTVEIHKNGAKPKPKLATGGSALTEGKDYAISYKNNKKAGTGTIVIKGKGNYTGNLEIPFRITVKDLTSPNITVRVPNVPYTGKPNKYQSALVLTDSDGGILAKNKDYAVEAYYMGKTMLDKKSNPKEGAEITVIIKGKGNYTGTIETSYSVKGIDFSKADIKVTAKRYTGSSVIIKSDDIISANIKTGKTKTALKFGTDYEIAAYSNNLKKGTATVTFKGIGAYAGEKTVKFKINSAQVQ